MANTIMSTVYNHYMTTYSPKRSDARLDNHKKSELKNIYNNIIKLNKESPLYLFDRSERTTNVALSLKENTRQLQHTILSTAGKAGVKARRRFRKAHGPDILREIPAQGGKRLPVCFLVHPELPRKKACCFPGL